MTDDEIAQMMLEECLHNAGIIEKSPFDDEVAQMMLEECLHNAGIIDKSPFHDEEEEKEE